MTFWEFVDKHLDRIDFKHVIAMVVTCWIMYIFTYVIITTLHDSQDRYIAQIVTALSNIIMTVLGFWFIASSTKKATEINPTTKS